MVGSYNLVYRASITNLRDSTLVVKDAAFTVTLVSCCALTTFDASPWVALTTMTTTALATTSSTQVLQIKDSISKTNSPSDGWTYCGDRLFTIWSGMSP